MRSLCVKHFLSVGKENELKKGDFSCFVITVEPSSLQTPGFAPGAAPRCGSARTEKHRRRLIRQPPRAARPRRGKDRFAGERVCRSHANGNRAAGRTYLAGNGGQLETGSSAESFREPKPAVFSQVFRRHRPEDIDGLLTSGTRGREPMPTDGCPWVFSRVFISC